MRKVVAYGRVSSQRQSDAGALERQERQLLEGVTSDEVILDVGSGKSTARPGYQRLLEMIGLGQVDRVLIKEQDRLNRNLMADLELWQLCEANNTTITDLHGREIEFRSPDGALLSTMVSAMNQHRSKAYGLKIRNGLEQARKDQHPARPASTFPYGYRPTRDSKGKIIGVELNPDTADAARERIDLFLQDNSLSETSRQILAKQGADLKPNALSNWLRHPYLRGRLCWDSDGKGNFADVADQPTFGAIISDAEADLIKARLAAASTMQGVRNRKRRILTGLVFCKSCGYSMNYKVVKQVEYLVCKHRHCKHLAKHSHGDLITGVLQYAMVTHAAAIVPLMDRPQVDPPGVQLLQQEIETLQNISGTESLVEQKRSEIASLRTNKSDTPQWLLLAAVRSQSFWLKDEEAINSILRAMGCKITVQLSDAGVKAAKVHEIKFSTQPANAPLPENQREILIPVTMNDLAVAATHQDQINNALATISS